MLEERQGMHPHIVENPKILSMEIASWTTLAHRIEPIRSYPINGEVIQDTPKIDKRWCEVEGHMERYQEVDGFS